MNKNIEQLEAELVELLDKTWIKVFVYVTVAPVAILGIIISIPIMAYRSGTMFADLFDDWIKYVYKKDTKKNTKESNANA